jgi:hypothetical protein
MTIVTGKHRELLIELLLYYLDTQPNHSMIGKYYSSISDNIKKRNMASDYWVKEFIDAPNDYGN